MILIADTSGIIAASDRSAPEAEACRTILGAAGTVIVSPMVLTEVDHMAKMRFGHAARETIIAFLLEQARRMRFQIPEITPDLLQVACGVQRAYEALRLDLADAVNVALAEVYRTNTLLTLDRRDFRALRPLGPHKAFRLLPDDL